MLLKEISNKTKNKIILKIKQRTKKIFNHEDFDCENKSKSIQGPMPNFEAYLESRRQIRLRLTQSIPESMRPCYDSPILTRSQEIHLFRKYNFYKYQAYISLTDDLKKSILQIKRADQTRQYLVSANARLAIPLLQRYRQTRHYEDLVAESYLLICRAIDFFDWRRGFKFSTYATWSISRTVGGAAGDLMRYDSQIKSASAASEEYRDRSVEVVAPTSESQIVSEHRTIQGIVSRLLDLCNPREKEILRLRFMKEQTLECIAQKYGVTRERIRQIEKRALIRINQHAHSIGITEESIWQ